MSEQHDHNHSKHHHHHDHDAKQKPALEHGHDHDHDTGAEELATLTSVGIDIGSSTSHLMFSRLRVGYPSFQRRQPEVLSRKVISRSRVLLTPFTGDWMIQPEPLRELIRSGFEEAGLTPDDVDTGAVIITGQAARRANARKIAELFSDYAGRFVCATAGARLETVLAANGSGAVHLSREKGLNLLNVDIGGGTTKVALVSRGRLLDTAAFNIGARLAAAGDDGRVIRLEDTGVQLLESLGRRVSLGDALDGETRSLMAKTMAELLLRMLRQEDPPWGDFVVVPFAQRFSLADIDGVLFSGGVSEYIYGREPVTFGDLGPILGQEIRKQMQLQGLRVLEAQEGLRATVIGASQYSIQMSGETIYIPNGDSLPLRNLRVFPVGVDWERPVTERAEKALLAMVRAIDPEVKDDPFALAVATPPFLGYGSALELAEGIRRALLALEPDERPRALIFQQNIGQVIGKTISNDFKLPCIDEVSLSELDFVDIGQPVDGEGFVPVVVKSLAFGS